MQYCNGKSIQIEEFGTSFAGIAMG